MLRLTEALVSIETRLADLVHASVEDGAERPTHERFIISRMVSGFLGLAAIPDYLAWRGAPSALDVVAILCLAAPHLAAFAVSRTGWLEAGYAVGAAAFAALILGLASSSDAVGWGALVLLAAIPLDAFLSGSRRAALFAVAATILVNLAAMAATTLPWRPALRWRY